MAGFSQSPLPMAKPVALALESPWNVLPWGPTSAPPSSLPLETPASNLCVAQGSGLSGGRVSAPGEPGGVSCPADAGIAWPGSLFSNVSGLGTRIPEALAHLTVPGSALAPQLPQGGRAAPHLLPRSLSQE